MDNDGKGHEGVVPAVVFHGIVRTNELWHFLRRRSAPRRRSPRPESGLDIKPQFASDGSDFASLREILFHAKAQRREVRSLGHEGCTGQFISNGFGATPKGVLRRTLVLTNIAEQWIYG